MFEYDVIVERDGESIVKRCMECYKEDGNIDQQWLYCYRVLRFFDPILRASTDGIYIWYYLCFGYLRFRCTRVLNLFMMGDSSRLIDNERSWENWQTRNRKGPGVCCECEILMWIQRSCEKGENVCFCWDPTDTDMNNWFMLMRERCDGVSFDDDAHQWFECVLHWCPILKI